MQVVLHDRDLRNLLIDTGIAPEVAAERSSTDFAADELIAMGVDTLASALDFLCSGPGRGPTGPSGGEARRAAGTSSMTGLSGPAALRLLVVDVKLPQNQDAPAPWSDDTLTLEAAVRSAVDRLSGVVGSSPCARSARSGGPELIFFSKDDAATEQLAVLGAAYDSASAYVVMNGTSRNIADGHHRTLLGRPGAAGAAAVHWSMALDVDVVSSLHHRGRRVFAWTVEAVDTAVRLAASGVDGIIADGGLLSRIDRAVDAFWTEECAR